METNKVPTSTSTTVSATSAAINPLFDPVALQTAYFAAAQLHNQLQQNSHLAATVAAAVDTTAVSASTITTTTANNIQTASHKATTPPPSPATCLPSFVDNDRLYSLLPPQLQYCLKQQQRNFLQQQQQSINTSLAHHFSAFSPINTDLPGAPTSTATTLLTQPSPLPPIPTVPSVAPPQQPIDLLLMQMQMATAAAAAAAGFFPTAFSVLPPVTAAALGLLTPQFRMLQLGDPNFSAYSTSANTSGIFTTDISSKGADDTSAIERSLLQAQINLLTNGSSLSSVVNEHTCATGTVSNASPNGVTSSPIQQLNPLSNRNFSSHNNNGNKQQRMQMKRPYDEMSILRSLCSENHTAEQEAAVICGKRSRLVAADESGRRSLQKSTKACNPGKNQQQYLAELDNKNLSDGSSKSNKKSDEKCVTSGLFDENSPDRHHPLNHRPPAMEARFLECMAAIALHSSISLPIKDENPTRNTNVGGSRTEENGINSKSERERQSTKDIELENSSRTGLKSVPPPDRLRPSENTSTATISPNENENKKYWPNSAIDEELCKELENYKNSDVPVIHAFVLPAKLSDSTSSLISDEKCSQDSPGTMVPESVAVPVPILNTLLDRILQTMLDP
uniref:POU domain protein n=1 Tax=Loa loa TaxID=7209 RepID=A0A1I7VSN5_LOALO